MSKDKKLDELTEMLASLKLMSHLNDVKEAGISRRTLIPDLWQTRHQEAASFLFDVAIPVQAL